MSASKLKLPTSLGTKRGASSNTSGAADHRTRQVEMETNAKLELGRMNVTMHALDVVKQALQVLQSYNELQSVKAEWQGRIEVADREYAKAVIGLEKARVDAAPQLEALANARAVQQRILELYDRLLLDAQNPAISLADKTQITNKLLQLTDNLVALRT
ncbi:hypothetical protein [Duganella sp. BuS-21]|uniref:hypothetical protein n=1 Tax=Duganella sp. BuS-21 TaxID=2943848 RepID=UPI0035A5C9EA